MFFAVFEKIGLFHATEFVKNAYFSLSVNSGKDCNAEVE